MQTTSSAAETLPTFEASEVVWDAAQYCQRPRGDQFDSFVRLACSEAAPSSVPLTDVLRMTDEALESFARRCGALVLPHSWGLVKVPDGQEWRLGDEMGCSTSHPDIPQGMLLAARVERIINPRRLSRADRKLTDQICQDYYRSMLHSSDGEPYLTDMRSVQFSHGALASKRKQKLRILHDIEPRLAINH